MKTAPTTAPPRSCKPIRWWRHVARSALAQWRGVPRPARQIGVAILGTGVLIAGLALIVLPGPAVLVIPLALAILASEFHWARRLLDWTKARMRRLEQAALTRFRPRSKRGLQQFVP